MGANFAMSRLLARRQFLWVSFGNNIKSVIWVTGKRRKFEYGPKSKKFPLLRVEPYFVWFSLLLLERNGWLFSHLAVDDLRVSQSE